MSKRTRWFLFYMAVLVFLLGSGITVISALGYSYDFDEMKFVQMGSLRIVSNADAEIYINDKLSGGTSFIGDTFSKGRLLPKIYTVRLEREGYHTWQKTVEITAGQFTDFPKVVLLPLKLEIEKVATTSFGFPISDANFRVYDEKKSLAFENNIINIEWLRDTDYQPFHRAGDFETIFSMPQKIDDVQWHRDGNHIFIASGGKLYFSEIDYRGGENTYPITVLNGPFWYEKDENAVYLVQDGELVRMKL